MSFHQIIANAMQSVRNIAGVCIIYRRGNHFIRLKATPGQTEMTTTNANGVTVMVSSRDYMIPVYELVLNGTPTLPQKEDTIEEQVGTKTYIYAVRRPDGGKQPYTFSDQGRTNIRIHSVLERVD